MSFVLTAIIMFVFWVILSGKITVLFLSLGFVASLLVAFIFHKSFMGVFFDRIASQELSSGIKQVFRCLVYLPWLIYQIIGANIHLAYIILHPRMPISPALIRFKSRVKKPATIVTFANSITLTPGTITVDWDDGEYCVHALDKFSAEGLLKGEMENKVARVFGED
ncbi:Na+/H+ antiporter subunit E [Thermodesulfovibrionales bacterium]|nr:Na+/H+ antiporter subunit E [Thermodesulfovibrionales bacterium]